MRFVYPTDGDMLTDAAGKRADGRLLISAAVCCEEDVSINGIAAQRQADGLQIVQAELSAGENRLCARANGKQQEIIVYYVPHAAGKYALSVDDNIWWLAELTRTPRASIFDHPYASLYKRIHERYGAKVRFNLFWQVEGSAVQKYGAFDLSQMTDRYKAEFEANSDWLHFAFHSRQESPGLQYAAASYDEVAADWQKMKREIIRFAGERSLECAATVHCGCCTEEGIRALQDGGIRMLMGFMKLGRDGLPSVSYNMSVEKVLEAQRYGLWKDHRSGMIYGKIDVVMNQYSPEKVAVVLERERREHPMRGFWEIMIHEQYFHEDYFNYEPDYEERIAAGCRWCREQGFEGAFAEEIVRGME